MRFHPFAELFPLIQGAEFDALVADIKAHGVREAIWTYHGQILDGRNRWRACEAAGIAHRPTREYEGDDPLAFVLSLNLQRRHLTEGQKAALALDLLPHLEAQARERQAHGATAPGVTLVERIPQALTQSQQQKIDAVMLDVRAGIITRDQANRKIARIDPDWHLRNHDKSADAGKARDKAADLVGARHVDNILLLELKTNGRDVPFAQRDTLWLIDQLRRQLCKGPGGRRSHVVCKGPRGEPRRVRWFGVHVLVLSGTSPSNSAEMFWNGQRIDESTLVEVLRFDRDPDAITRQLDYRRHHRPAQSSMSLLAALEEAI